MAGAAVFSKPWEEIEPGNKYRLGLPCRAEITAELRVGTDSGSRPSWYCELKTDPDARPGKFSVMPEPGEDPGRAVLLAAIASLDSGAAKAFDAADAVWRMLQDSMPKPDGPSVIYGPVPGRWYDAEKYLPAEGKAVIVAWIDTCGRRHSGDRAAFFNNGAWYWAHGEQEAVPHRYGVRILAWACCHPFIRQKEDAYA